MNQTRIADIYDPLIGAQYMSVADAAKYLNYGEFSIRRLIVQGKLKPRGKIGNKWMFLKEELDRFKSASQWAARKSGIAAPESLPPVPPSKLKAEVTVYAVGGLVVGRTETIAEFTWEQLPLIRARTHKIHGDAAFDVSVQSPDGASWRISYEPPTWFEKAWKRVVGK